MRKTHDEFDPRERRVEEGRPRSVRFRPSFFKTPGSRAWKVYLVLGVLVTGVYLLLPAAAKDYLYDLIALSSVVAILAGIRLHRPERPLPWYLLALGNLVWLASDVAWTIYENVLRIEPPFLSAAAGFYLGAYPLIIAGLLLIQDRSLRRYGSGLVDPLIVATGMGMLSWVFLMDPYVEDRALGLLERLVSISFPLMDVLLLAVVVRLLLAPGRHSPAYYLLSLSPVLLLISDTLYTAMALSGTFEDDGLLDAGWLLAKVIFGVAALHPTMATLYEPGTGREARPTWQRFGLLAGASLMAPAMLVIQAARGEPIDVPVIAGGSAALFMLVLLRMENATRARQKTLERLQASEAELRGLFASMSDVVLVLDREGRCLKVAPTDPSLLHEPAGELVGKTLHEVLPAEQADELLGCVRRALETQQTTNMEYSLRIEGRAVWFAATVSPLREDTVVWVARDITGRKKAEARLRLRGRVIAASTDAVVITDPNLADNALVYVNPAFKRDTGYAAEEVIGRNCRFLQGEDRDQPAMDELRAAVEEERECTVVLRNYRKDGTMFWNELDVFPVHDEDGRLVNFVGVQNDITERKRAEEALKESEERLRQLADATFEGILITDGGEVLEVNRALMDMFGYEPSETVGRSALEFVAPEYRALVWQKISSGSEQPYEIAGLRKDGTRLDLEVRGTSSSSCSGKSPAWTMRSVSRSASRSASRRTCGRP